MNTYLFQPKQTTRLKNQVTNSDFQTKESTTMLFRTAIGLIVLGAFLLGAGLILYNVRKEQFYSSGLIGAAISFCAEGSVGLFLVTSGAVAAWRNRQVHPA
eukprot:CAMPEP_0168573996 /NCGR_PEP_ID=MMETSP0413-20121227/18835_1 /TAXON_ID=136452 /ORGANISM="Filamoeba nolandi, Strain NC-AS-23-1" /LENGTH=100 /DNA_ID=CAMNT_0008607289 /DNA_START=102 /DNA_END=404 /DNA_ORIENTATION=-